MVKYKNIISVFIIIIFTQFSYGQKVTSDKLFESYQNAETKESKIKYVVAFLKQSKKEKNNQKILAGYYILSNLFDNDKKLSYLDSIINITKFNPTKHQPSIAYNAKAIYLQKKGEYEKAIDNYILSNKFATSTNSEDLHFLNNFNLGTIKRIIGEYHESLKLFRKCFIFTKKSSNSGYDSNHLKTIISLSNVHYELKNIDSATYYNKLGISIANKYKKLSKYHHLGLSQGIIHFINDEEKIALDSINKHKNYFIIKNDSANLSYAYFYLAKIYANKGLTKKAVNHHKKIDSLLSFKKDLTPKFRDSYIFLINHYKKENDLKNQLLYIKRLMEFDSILNSKTNYLNKVIFKEYDIPKLKLEKENIKKEMAQKSVSFKKTIYVISFLLLLAIIFLIYQYQKRKIYKERFYKIIEEKKTDELVITNDVNTQLDIPSDVIENILHKLIVFEKEKLFLRKNITLNSLAKELNTNTAYLSKVINHYKKEKFSTYLNNLKIEHIVDEIKKNPILKKFTIKAIAEEAYFNNPDSFSKAFYKLKGIKPSYFFKEFNDLDKK